MFRGGTRSTLQPFGHLFAGRLPGFLEVTHVESDFECLTLAFAQLREDALIARFRPADGLDTDRQPLGGLLDDGGDVGFGADTSRQTPAPALTVSRRTSGQRLPDTPPRRIDSIRLDSIHIRKRRPCGSAEESYILPS